MIIADWSWWTKDISSRKSKMRKIETKTDLQLELREKEKRKENAENNSERGDCIRLMTKGQYACASKHDPNKKGKGKGRPRSPSPTGSPHRISKGDGKGNDVGGAEGTPKNLEKSPSGKANRLPCTNINKIMCQRGHSRNYWHVVKWRQIRTQVCMQTHSNTC